MSLIEHSLTLTPDELHCLTCAMAGNFPERFAPIRMDLLRKLAKAQRTNTRGAVDENEKLRLQVAALENDDIELAAKLGETEEQIARLTTLGRAVKTMSLIERWITVCPEHGASSEVSSKPHTRGCWYWSTDDVQCREKVECIRLTNDQGAVGALERLADPDSWPAHARPHRHTVRFAQQALDNLQPGVSRP